MTTAKCVRLCGGLILAALLASACASGRVAHAKHAPEAQPVTERHEVHFDFNKAAIRSDDEGMLKDVADRIKGDPKAVAIVEGHADQIGESDYNEVLAENRARAVRVYLRDQGADPRRLTMTSKGEREPIVRGYGREALQPNRRVEIFLTLKGGSRD
jgi:outer membrane protein OmpA-like peptidoglycan-associated protein